MNVAGEPDQSSSDCLMRTEDQELVVAAARGAAAVLCVLHEIGMGEDGTWLATRAEVRRHEKNVRALLQYTFRKIAEDEAVTPAAMPVQNTAYNPIPPGQIPRSVDEATIERLTHEIKSLERRLDQPAQLTIEDLQQISRQAANSAAAMRRLLEPST